MSQAISQWYNSFHLFEHEDEGHHGARPSELVSIAQLCDFYDECALQQLATDTIVAELMKDAIVWEDENGVELADEQVPLWVPSIVAEVVRNLVVCGWVVWRVAENGMIQVAHPLEMTIEYLSEDNQWHPRALSPQIAEYDGWIVAFSAMPMPSLAAQTEKQRVTINHMRSAAKRSWLECNRVMQIERHWITRDRHNSAPAVFTSVTPALGLPLNRATTGSAMVAEHGPQFGLPGVGDFNDLIHRRAAKRALMEDLSERDRNRVQAQTQFAGYELTTDTAAHAEHVVTDGRAHSEAKGLNSLADSGYVYNRSRHNALMLMGCPPQALGESVNSERTAANHAQYATALATFKSTVDLYRAALQQILSGGSPQTSMHMTFKRCLSPADLNTVMPILTTEAAAQMYACTFMIPESMIDPQRLAQFQNGPPNTKNVGERTLRNQAVAADV